VRFRAYDSIVNRWFLAALGVAVAGITVAFAVVPYGSRDCPGLLKCDPWGARPRMLTLLITGLLVLALVTVAVLHSDRNR
jgi:hypothetical protein